MDEPVAPVLHVLPINEDDINVTLSPAHIVAGPDKVIEGAGGFGFTTMDADAVSEVHPFTSVTLTL